MTDLADMTDLNELKALAYDCIANVEQAQKNLQMVNQRIAEVQQAPAKAKPVHQGRVTRPPAKAKRAVQKSPSR